MDLARGSVTNYVNRTITILNYLFSIVVLRLKRKENSELFYQAVGFLDGPEIVLRHEYCFSWKKNYGFNLAVSMYMTRNSICLGWLQYTEFNFRHAQVRLWIELYTCTNAESDFKQTR